MSTQDGKPTAQYRPDIFNVQNIEQAKAIILTPEDGLSPEERWQKETPLLANDLSQALTPDQNSLTIDYGCGIGRMARELLVRHGGSVLGVDISTSMRSLAHQYVDHPGFACAARNGLASLVRHGFQADSAYAIWVLQHSAEPEQDIDLIWSALKPGGLFLVVNIQHRIVPTDKGWANDGKNITTMLENRFPRYKEITLSNGAITEAARKVAECRVYKK